MNFYIYPIFYLFFGFILFGYSGPIRSVVAISSSTDTRPETTELKQQRGRHHLRRLIDADRVDFGDGRIKYTLNNLENGDLQIVLETNEDKRGITVNMVYAKGDRYIAFGFSNDLSMIGSVAVIALPNDGTNIPQKYDLNGRSVALVNLSPPRRQTLQNAMYKQNLTHTEMTFSKFIQEDDEPVVTLDGDNFFLYAIGPNNDLGYHAIRKAFTLNFNSNTAEPTPAPMVPTTMIPTTMIPTALQPITGPISVPSNDGGGGGLCFSGNNLVNVQGKGLITMGKLQIGDYVLADMKNKKRSEIHPLYSRVISFSHKDIHSEAEYIQIHLTLTIDDNDNNDHKKTFPPQPLEISNDHIVKKYDGTFVRAKDIQVGDLLTDNNNLIVVEIIKVKRRGLYAPVTETGTIIVSNVTASNYVAILDDYIIPASIQHYIAHYILYTPIRYMCQWNFQHYCINEQYTNGISNKIYGIINIVTKITKHSNAINQIAVMIAVIAPIVIIAVPIVQLLFVINNSNVAAMLLFGFAGIVFYMKKHKKMKTM